MKLFIQHCPLCHQMNVGVPVSSSFFSWMVQVLLVFFQYFEEKKVIKLKLSSS